VVSRARVPDRSGLTGADLAITYSTDAYPYLRFVKLSLSRR
jgi:hypothetical protein